jgi:hypothetical protein
MNKTKTTFFTWYVRLLKKRYYKSYFLLFYLCIHEKSKANLYKMYMVSNAVKGTLQRNFGLPLMSPNNSHKDIPSLIKAVSNSIILTKLNFRTRIFKRDGIEKRVWFLHGIRRNMLWRLFLAKSCRKVFWQLEKSCVAYSIILICISVLKVFKNVLPFLQTARLIDIY